MAQVDQVGEVEKGLVVEVVPVVEVVDQEGAVAWNWRWRARRKWTQWRLPKRLSRKENWWWRAISSIRRPS